MQVERELVIETAVSVFGVGLFIALLVIVGLQFSRDGLTETGAYGVIGAIVVFVLVMTGVGYWLSTRESED